MPTSFLPAPGSAAAAAVASLSDGAAHSPQSSNPLELLSKWLETQLSQFSENDAKKKLIRVINEFMCSELKFIGQLKMLVSVIDSLKLNETKYAFFHAFIKHTQEIIKAYDKWNPCAFIESKSTSDMEVLERLSASFETECYRQYMKHMGMCVLLHQQRQNELINKVDAKIGRNHQIDKSFGRIDALLILPVQRGPRHELLLKEMLHAVLTHSLFTTVTQKFVCPSRDQMLPEDLPHEALIESFIDIHVKIFIINEQKRAFEGASMSIDELSSVGLDSKDKKVIALRRILNTRLNSALKPTHTEVSITILKNMLFDAYPEYFAPVDEVSAAAAAQNPFGTPHNLDPSTFQYRDLNKRYQETQDPLWLVLISTMPVRRGFFTLVQKTKAYIDIASAFWKGDLGAKDKYKGAFLMAEIAFGLIALFERQNLAGEALTDLQNAKNQTRFAFMPTSESTLVESMAKRYAAGGQFGDWMVFKDASLRSSLSSLISASEPSGSLSYSVASITEMSSLSQCSSPSASSSSLGVSVLESEDLISGATEEEPCSLPDHSTTPVSSRPASPSAASTTEATSDGSSSGSGSSLSSSVSVSEFEDLRSRSEGEPPYSPCTAPTEQDTEAPLIAEDHIQDPFFENPRSHKEESVYKSECLDIDTSRDNLVNFLQKLYKAYGRIFLDTDISEETSLLTLRDDEIDWPYLSANERYRFLIETYIASYSSGRDVDFKQKMLSVYNIDEEMENWLYQGYSINEDALNALQDKYNQIIALTDSSRSSLASVDDAQELTIYDDPFADPFGNWSNVSAISYNSRIMPEALAKIIQEPAPSIVEGPSSVNESMAPLPASHPVQASAAIAPHENSQHITFLEYCNGFKRQFTGTNSDGVKQMIKIMDALLNDINSESQKYMTLKTAMLEIAQKRVSSGWSKSSIFGRGRELRVSVLYKELIDTQDFLVSVSKTENNLPFNEFCVRFSSMFHNTNSTGVKQMMAYMDRLLKDSSQSDANKFILLKTEMCAIQAHRKGRKLSTSNIFGPGRAPKVSMLYQKIATEGFCLNNDGVSEILKLSATNSSAQILK